MLLSHPSPVLEAENLECQRGGRCLFAGVGFALAAGEFLLAQGANGAGKTSLLRMICGLLPPATGRIRWRGSDIRRLAGDFRAELCFLGHQSAIKEELTPLENLVDAARLAGLALDEPTTLAALAQVGLAGREDLACRDLSQGQKRRVALARLVFDTRPLWVLDEPFVALDARAVAWLAGLIGRHVAAGGLAVLTTHQPVDIPGGVLRELSLREARS